MQHGSRGSISCSLGWIARELGQATDGVLAMVAKEEGLIQLKEDTGYSCLMKYSALYIKEFHVHKL